MYFVTAIKSYFNTKQVSGNERVRRDSRLFQRRAATRSINSRVLRQPATIAGYKLNNILRYVRPLKSHNIEMQWRHNGDVWS